MIKKEESEPELKYYTKRSYSRGSQDDFNRDIFDGIDEAINESAYAIKIFKG